MFYVNFKGPCFHINQKHEEHPITQNSIPRFFNNKLQEMDDRYGYSISFYIFFKLFVGLSFD